MGKLKVSLNIEEFSSHLLWEFDRTTMNIETHASTIISRVLLYGFYSDWIMIKDFYGLEMITKVALKMRDIDKKTASFIALLAGINKEKFTCYSSKPLLPQHWNF